MNNELDGQKIKAVLLEVVEERSKIEGRSLQQLTILQAAAERLGVRSNKELSEALLTAWYDLFRTGILSWGMNLENPNPPFCHLTGPGREVLRNLSVDPANPEGYLANLSKCGGINPVAKSYIEEALHTYNSNCFKAAAVMVGASAESLVLELRDSLVKRMEKPAKALEDWRLKTIADALRGEVTTRSKSMPRDLAERVDGYWPGFLQQIRATRNEAGHPKSVDPVSPGEVHASLLMFPYVLKLTADLKSWIEKEFASHSGT